jgi:bacteriocin biosynthesis cyclodehydratase domain-containing protein
MANHEQHTTRARRPPAAAGGTVSHLRRPGSGQPRPVINETAALVWRDRATLQIELADTHVIVDDIGTEQMRTLMSARPGSSAPATTSSEPDRGVDELRRTLGALGLLTAGPVETTVPASALPAYLTPERSALTARCGDQAGRILAARRQRTVVVQGTGRLGSCVASALAASGVGAVYLNGTGEVSAADACPGGLSPTDEGARFGGAAVAAIRRAAPDVHTGPLPFGHPVDLVLLTDPGPFDPSLLTTLHLDNRPHLVVAVDGGRAVIGPLVVPGVTSCLHCADLHRTDRDPAWPLLAVQLSGPGRPRRGSDVALCLAAAGVAVSQALAHLDPAVDDGPAAIATANGTLEWQLPDWRLRRRTWPAHRDCDCGAAAAVAPTRHNEWVIMR